MQQPFTFNHIEGDIFGNFSITLPLFAIFLQLHFPFLQFHFPFLPAFIQLIFFIEIALLRKVANCEQKLKRLQNIKTGAMF